MNVYTVDYFIEKFSNLEFKDPFDLLDPGQRKEFKKFNGVDEYDVLFLAEKGSEFDAFQDILWSGTWESPVDIIEGKCKKFKFLNGYKDVKTRIINCLMFIKKYGNRCNYWSMGLAPEEIYEVLM